MAVNSLLFSPILDSLDDLASMIVDAEFDSIWKGGHDMKSAEIPNDLYRLPLRQNLLSTSQLPHQIQLPYSFIIILIQSIISESQTLPIPRYFLTIPGKPLNA
jgi:hypothetical protein